MTDTNSPPEPNSAGKLRTIGMPFALLCFGVWLHAAESMLVATTLPSAVREFGGGTLISWAFSLYLLGSILAGSGTPVLLRSISVKAALLIAAVIFLIGTIGCASAANMPILLVGRLIQGIGGGFLVALAFVCVNRWYDPALVPRLIALISVVWSTSAFFGPLVGGSFATFGYWRMAFWVFVLQGIVFIGATLLAIPKGSGMSRPSGGSAFPTLRLSLISLSVLSISIAGTKVHLVMSPSLCVLSLVFLWLAFRLDRATPLNRMFPAQSLHLSASVCIGLSFILLISLASMSFLVFGPILLETIHGITPLSAGYIVALESIFWGVGAVLVSYVPAAERIPESRAIRTGVIAVAASVLAYAFFIPNGPLIAVVLIACVQGLGFGIMWGYVIKQVSSTVTEDEIDVVSSAIPTLQQLGFAIGAAAAGIVANASGFSDTVSLASAIDAGFWVFAAFLPAAAMAVAAAWRLTQSEPMSGVQSSEVWD